MEGGVLTRLGSGSVMPDVSKRGVGSIKEWTKQVCDAENECMKGKELDKTKEMDTEAYVHTFMQRTFPITSISCWRSTAKLTASKLLSQCTSQASVAGGALPSLLPPNSLVKWSAVTRQVTTKCTSQAAVAEEHCQAYCLQTP
eukprot:1159989-Pelagomonas_calceolata.AAC.17